MKLKCAQRGDMESESNRIFLCHHCGKPVCQEHSVKVDDDGAFADPGFPPSIAAVHCPDCARQHHGRGDGWREWAGATS
jgi:hypothetical protein